MPPTSTGGSSDADSALMSAVLAAISRARRDPSSCAGRIRARLAHFSGKDYADPGRPGRVKVTKEGGLAVRDALQYLSQVEPERAPFFRTEQEPGLELSAGVRQLRHHFWPAFAHFSAPPHPARGVCYALLRARADRVLIGAWNPMLWPIWGCRHRPALRLHRRRAAGGSCSTVCP